MSEIKWLQTLNFLEKIKNSELSHFLDTNKLIHSMIFHQIASGAARHLCEHRDLAYVQNVLGFFPYKSNYYLKAIVWFNSRTGLDFMIIDGKLKLNRDKNHEINEDILNFGDFLKTYKGPLPLMKEEKTRNTPKIKNKDNNSGYMPDKLDLINGSLKLGGKRVFGGYGTSKRK